MQRVTAVKKLGKILGKSFGYRIDLSAPLAEERDEVRKTIPELTKARDAADKAVRERSQALLAADAEYQALVAVYREAKKNANKAFSRSNHFRFTVGTSNGMFFHVKAQGDSWEDVIRKLS